MVKKIKHIIGDSYWAIVLLAFIVLVINIGCGELAPTVQPNPISQQVNPNDPGSLYPRVLDVYPADGSTDIPVDTSIIIVFNKPIDITTISPSTIKISGVSSFNNISTAQDDKVIIIDAGTFGFNHSVDVTITTAVRDSEGNPLPQEYTSTFQTGLDDSSYFKPKVVASTRFPTGNSVPRDVGYVEVTFTKDMDNSTISVANFNFTGPAISVTQINSKTYRLNINTLNYDTTYTVNLSSSIKDIDGNNLDLDGNHTWQFTTEPDPTTIPLDISDVWITNVTSNSITIQFTTTKPVAQNQCYAVYGTTSPVDSSFTHIQESSSTDATTLHTVAISSLSSFTRYYIKAGINTTGGTPVEILSTEEVSTYTNTDNTNNSVLSNTLANQYSPVTLQTHTFDAYVFWLTNENGNIDIYGQYFDSTGNPVWGANGTAIANHSNNQQGIVAITDGFSDAIILYNDSNNLYGKMIYNNVGSVVFRWGGPDSNQGIDLNIGIKPGSKYSATLVHEQPEIIVTGIADMPDDGTATNLLYDANVDFSAYSAWLDVDDLLLTNIIGINWTSSSIQNQLASPFDIFPYIIKSTLNANLSSWDYYIVDSDTSFSGTADSGTTTTELRSSTDSNFLLVHSGDIVHNVTNNEWGLALSSGQWDNINGYYKISIDRVLTNLNDGDTYTIYLNPLGPFTSEAVTNPLWDVNPNPLFNPGITVLENDVVVNENDNNDAATYAYISAIDFSKDTNYALRLSNDIIDNGDEYAIIRMPAGVTIKGVGYSTSTVDFELIDSRANFTGWIVQPGDIVYNIDANLSAMVKTVVNANTLTISADIFNAINDKYILYTKRAFLVAYIDNSNNVMAKVFSIADGSQLYAFAVCTDGINSNPLAISDEAGNAMIFYEKSGNIYGKKVSAKGQFDSSWGSDADEAGDIGHQILTGYNIVQVLPDKNMNTVGGAYLLAKNATNTQFRLLRISGVDGGTMYDSGNINGSDPMMVIDSVNDEINRAIIVYRNTHTTGGITYYHIEARAYMGGLLWGPIIVSSNTADYNCVQPVISMADNSTAVDNFYIAWFDGRYYGTNGYSIFIQRYNATPTQQWTANGLLASFPSSYGYDYPLSLKLIYWNDGATPYGAIPIWLDYRDYSSTNTDIYYQRIVDSSTFFP